MSAQNPGNNKAQPVTIYTIDNCPFCTNAKNLMGDQKIAFSEIHVDRNDAATRAELMQRSGMKTFPQIFFGKNLVGGYTELKKLYDSGELQTALKGH